MRSSWSSGIASICHRGTVQTAAATVVSAFTVLTQDLDRLTKQIWDDKNANDTIDVAPTDGGYLSDFAKIPPTEYVTGDNKITPAEGARFNVRMLREGGADGSHGVHNPFLARALLGADIDELQVAYPGLPPAAPAVQGIMQRSLGTMYKRPPLRPVIARPISSR